jgi:hypothetical protein
MGGALVFSTGDTSNRFQQGQVSILYADFMFIIGGENSSGAVAPVASSGAYGSNPNPPPQFVNFNDDPGADTGPAATPVPAFAGLAFGSSHFGGTADGSTALARVWTQVY